MRTRTWQTDAETEIREAKKRWAENDPDRDLVRVRALPRSEERMRAIELPMEGGR